jgi:broad specificity phosphatase PhoE
MSRRRIYLLRHAEVSYFEADGTPVDPEQVALTAAGREQAEAARRALAGVSFDRVVASRLPRTIETAEIVAPAREVEPWPEFAEWRGGRLRDIPEAERQQAFVGALRADDEAARFLGGESLGELLDRVLPALDRLLAGDWDTLLAVFHGGINRIVLSHALTGGRAYFGGFEQAPACINVLDVGPAPAPAEPGPSLPGGSVEPTPQGPAPAAAGPQDWVVRTVNYIPYDPLHPARSTTMEQYWEQYSAGRA